MPERLSSEARSRNMAAVTSRNTAPELVVRRLLHKAGYRFRLHKKELPGCPDIVLASRRIAIFVNGCFWHSHDCNRGKSTPVKNAAFWHTKRAATVARDARTLASLESMGWHVIFIWECTVKSGEFSAPLLAQLASYLVDRPQAK